MKKVIRLMLLLTAVFAFTCTAAAQHRKGGERISREQLAQKQAKHIAEKLALSPEVSEKFIATYTRCQQEVWAQKPRRGQRKDAPLTEAQTDSVLQSQFDQSQKLLDIRKKYYSEYSTFLTPKQIEQVYEQERKIKKRLFDRRNARKK